ncbi:hypothetical protein [Novosphingobium sp. JCM 18896]|uniref:hypothetical protein n=1 Tax=Novosphingobium sp. JCM 18896 TaxID=2989731 RepID=UPI0022215339|nr:hypothetical protein [Novosphingobium sp. JCM 18896]MCW1431595.1 hypothetical protein [Novosphingobium sp. JCM 18896]
MRLRTVLLAGAALLGATSAFAQRSDLTVDQVSPASSGSMQQIGDVKSVPSSGISQVSRTASPVTASQVVSPRAGQDPRFGQTAPRASSNASTSQLVDRNTRPGVAALPQGLVDACDRAAAGQGPAPKGVDCSIVVQAAPPVALVSAEESLLTNATERDAQRAATERFARGNAPDAGEVALRLSTGDIANSPVAQAVAAQAAAQALQNATGGTGTGTGGTPVIVPGGGTVAPPTGN